MFTSTTATFICIMMIVATSVYRMLTDLKSDIGHIFMNIILGGFFFTVLNLFGFYMRLNIMNAGIISLLGAPGVAFIVILKILFMFF